MQECSPELERRRVVASRPYPATWSENIGHRNAIPYARMRPLYSWNAGKLTPAACFTRYPHGISILGSGHTPNDERSNQESRGGLRGAPPRGFRGKPILHGTSPTPTRKRGCTCVEATLIGMGHQLPRLPGRASANNLRSTETSVLRQADPHATPPFAGETFGRVGVGGDTFIDFVGGGEGCGGKGWRY